MSAIEAPIASISGGGGSSTDASALKSRYYKFLEALCTANGVDVASLRDGNAELEVVEMFFGAMASWKDRKWQPDLHIHSTLAFLACTRWPQIF